jgi:flavin-dependent dehydrogenase
MSLTPPQNGRECDVLIIGGGPAGSTTATLLARMGWNVTLVEKDRHPRFHIGESLLPMNMPIFERLGLLDKLNAIGVKKLGADFPAPNERGYNVFRFERMLNDGWRYAYQVKREELDLMLFRHAAENGVNAIEGAKVTRVSFDTEGATADIEQDTSGTSSIRARYIVDASGRDTFLGNKLRLKRKHRKHQSAALFAHFRGVQRRPGEDAGNISVYRFEHGWFWLIPLQGDCTSVGAVCSPQYLKQRDGSNADFLMQTLRSVPQLWERMKNAEILGNLHATGNYSYTSTRMAGSRWIMVGDAYAFLDPIFSTGVLLAMNSAQLAADVVNRVLRDPSTEKALQRAYGRKVRQAIDSLSWFIYRFTSPAMRYLFSNPRNVFRVEEAMISMLAGDVFHNGRGVRWRLKIFKLIYLITSLSMWKDALRSALARRRQARSTFTGGTTSHDPA